MQESLDKPKVVALLNRILEMELAGAVRGLVDLTADCARFSALAAREKLPASETAMNTRI